MNRLLFGPFGLGILEPLVLGAGLVTSALWLAAAAFVYAFRAPPKPEPGPRTLDLGPEPPAVANFLVNGFKVTDDAVPATVLDLAARRIVEMEQRGPEAFYLRLWQEPPPGLADYERCVLAHLQRRSDGGVVPVRALTTGQWAESRGWWSGLRSEVIADAQARGLSRDALPSRVFALLAAAAAVPAACLWAARGLGAAAMMVAVAAVLLSWIRRRHPQRETTAGLEAAARWHGVRAELASNEELARHSPLTVNLWDRLLAYGAALGAAPGAARSLPLGVESDTRAWSSLGGSWREIRIRYPRVWPLAWGSEPSTAFLTGVAVVVASVLALRSLGSQLVDAGFPFGLPVVALGIGMVLGAIAAVTGAADWKTAIEVTGPIIRRRAYQSKNGTRYYLAIDDGSSASITALRVSRDQFEQAQQGHRVTIRLTPRLGRVRFIVPASDAV